MSNVGLLVAAAVAVAGLAGCTPQQRGEAPPATPSYRDQVARGRHLVTTMGCNDCHTPWKPGPQGPVPDMERMLSGHPAELVAGAPPPAQGPWLVAATATFTGWAGPWGISYASNLTPDDETGLGSWSEDDFVQTIRNGKHMGSGRPLLPPMPVPNMQALPDDDLKAIYAYLRSIPAVGNRVPDPVVAAPPQLARN